MQKSIGTIRTKNTRVKTTTKRLPVHPPVAPYYLGAEGERHFRALNETLMRTIKGETVLFLTDGAGEKLWQHYLQSFTDPAERQHHNCWCCQRFIQRVGSLVTITESGNVTSALWNPQALPVSAPSSYKNMVRRMKEYVENGTVCEQFLWKDLVFGTPQEGGFSHFWFPMMTGNCNPALTPGQDMAIRREDRKHLEIAIREMDREHVKTAVHMLEVGGLDRADTLLPMAKFLMDVQDATKNLGAARLNRVLWYYVGRAARGWCTPRASAFGALYEDIAAGKGVGSIARSHNEKMDPLKYQRPQAPPKAGNIKAAETLFEKLDLATALQRRPMALVEAELLWQPSPPRVQPPRSGLFSHLDPPSVPSTLPTNRLNSSPVLMTLTKFKREVMPKAYKILLKTPYQGNYGALVTAVHPHAQPLFQWDRPEYRNPANWYLYIDEAGTHGQRKGSYASRWGLPYNVWVEVLGICDLPCDWHGETRFKNISQGINLFILQGARDSDNSSICLFPETLRSELHPVRSTIEAHSKSGKLHPERRQRASGYMVGSGERVLLEVTNHAGVASYAVDRVE